MDDIVLHRCSVSKLHLFDISVSAQIFHRNLHHARSTRYASAICVSRVLAFFHRTGDDLHTRSAMVICESQCTAKCHQRTIANTTEQSSQIGHRKGQTRNMRCLHVCVERLMLTLVSLSLCAALSPFLQQRSICSSEQRFSRSSSRTPIQCDKCTESGYTIRACESSWTMDLLAVQTISSDASHS